MKKILNKCYLYIPPISWLKRAYHLFKQDESDWEAIDNNLKCIVGNIILAGVIVIIIVLRKI